ncbi:DUF1284 domain-containing protein [Kineothrix sp. MB12-C1]|uniref:DUF1284 domain-containing protein n=1 Tax=Kineothrix sp. MB12-C1 TaxID=3070215 RepID=UPI0027D2EC75|nr:DUF1284 domain-containing protein [Kineothrix sp. MB12-C1]WMC91056.1 DUF1284 domain-containing protein [Kineothrix sp. MB12-C1]
MMNIYKIRAHHGMCLAFFEGKGYSNGFVKHMAEIKGVLDKNPMVRLLERMDEICSACPHNKEKYCESEEKVLRYDSQVLHLCGLEAGREMEWKQFERLVEENIIGAGRRKEICGDCEWSNICHRNS